MPIQICVTIATKDRVVEFNIFEEKKGSMASMCTNSTGISCIFNYGGVASSTSKLHMSISITTTTTNNNR